MRYFLSFYFWLDILSTASLLLDITWLLSALLDIENTDKNIPANLGIFSKTSRGVRIGSRAGRIARITRLFRAERMISLYRQTRMSLVQGNLATQGDSMSHDSFNVGHSINASKLLLDAKTLPSQENNNKAAENKGNIWGGLFRLTKGVSVKNPNSEHLNVEVSGDNLSALDNLSAKNSK